jgi:hypothetical protein
MDSVLNKHIVREIIEVLILYGRQNIAILEHNKDKCNSMAICVMCPNTSASPPIKATYSEILQALSDVLTYHFTVISIIYR